MAATIAAIEAIEVFIPATSLGTVFFLFSLLGTIISHPGSIAQTALFLRRDTIPFKYVASVPGFRSRRPVQCNSQDYSPFDKVLY